MSKLINPSISCKKKNLKKFITFNKKPKNEIDFGLLKKKYIRHYYKCRACGHLLASHDKYLFDKLYENVYFESTYKSKKNYLKFLIK